MRKLIFALLLTFAAASFAAADTIYLRSGTSIRGNVLGFINGRFAIQLTAPATLPVGNRTVSGTQPGYSQTTRTVREGEVIFLRPREIDRIEIDGRSLDEARYQTRTLDVALGPNWIDSGVDVRRGERIRIDASGTIYAGRSRITPAGLSSNDPYAPLPRFAEGALIGVVGNDYNSPILEIGAGRDFTADRDGRLYLTANRGSYTDARGAFSVRIRKEIDLTAMARTADDRNTNDTYDPFYLPGEGDTANAPVRSREPGYDPNRNRDGGRRNRMSESTIDVQGTESRGVDTGIQLRTGDQVVISATGNITAGRRVGVVSPDGQRPGATTLFGTRPVPTAGVGALIGYILQPNGQQTQAFFVGSQLTFTASADGRLFLLVNDDNYNDNSGSFSVRIQYPDNR
ncbi:MAG TPA: LecA/PA-IL family lectin [Pyrinomonadaceae bacterium]|nr:LecA/PA-IL family lectin [Pyrinomonadaceae bacterium]